MVLVYPWRFPDDTSNFPNAIIFHTNPKSLNSRHSLAKGFWRILNSYFNKLFIYRSQDAILQETRCIRLSYGREIPFPGNI
ncbi:hypothetical protein ZYGR_0N03110 [Zygosaccharomyces rouxii]|uniref:Uncharacterized protein n=1 Tax=Zygosaccharomyces rouxii TaxID=4956 RepID=A0A1Q2ZZM0_ZYGRO|nr:hypothetical protein ZYGR_0N03110 [Zygosaccharomyces rouxii]